MQERDADRQQAFAQALEALADERALSVEQLDALSLLRPEEIVTFEGVWSGLPAPARARAIHALRAGAEDRLRLDFSALNALALNDEDAEVRLAAVESALEDRSPRWLDRLLEMLRSDPSVAVRRAAAEDLARFTLLAELEDLGPAESEQVRLALAASARDGGEESEVRASALAALGYFSDDGVGEMLLEGFANPRLRVGAVRGMGRSADPRWTDRLMPVLGSEDPELRLQAAAALGEIEDERAAGPLAELVDDPEPEVRLAVVDALGHIGGEEAREALLYCLESGSDEVRQAAERALSLLEENEEELDL